MPNYYANNGAYLVPASFSRSKARYGLSGLEITLDNIK